MNEVLKNIYGRRSVRAYSDEPVSEEAIKEIIKAGFHAPNGMNVQALRFVVVQKRELLTQYSEIGKRMSIANFKNRLEASRPAGKDGPGTPDREPQQSQVRYILRRYQY